MFAATEIENKRPKLEPHASATSTGTMSSSASQHGGDIPVNRVRVESSASNTGQWIPGDVSSPPLTVNVPRTRTSPPSTSPAILPGYRDTVFAEGRNTLAWRDGLREEQHLPGIGSVGANQSGPPTDTLNSPASNSHAHRTVMIGNPPPLLTRESTNRSTGSSNFSYGPRTPMEGPLEPPSASYYPKKLGSYENQLPPILTPALSPRSSIVNALHSPNGKYTPLYLAKPACCSRLMICIGHVTDII